MVRTTPPEINDNILAFQFRKMMDLPGNISKRNIMEILNFFQSPEKNRVAVLFSKIHITSTGKHL